MKCSSFAYVLSLFLLATCVANATDQPPNVVLIFADDLGYGDLGCYGATKVQTPNIDRLAAEGRRFTDAHSVSAVCTPSRYALMTGEYPVRGNGGRGVWGPAPVTSALIVDTDKTTIADVFKSSGYDTAAFGKWHLGFGEEKNNWQEPLRPGPQDLGFDHYFGMPVVNSAPPYVYVEDDHVVGGDPTDPLVFLGRTKAKDVTPITPIPPEAAQRSPNQFGGAKKAHELFNDYEVGTTIAKKSVEWIKQRKDTPFFLYLATTNIHHPFTPAKRFQGTSQCGLYGDFIHELDWIVGEVLSCLEDNGLSENTLVIFTSDNGGMFNFGGQAAFKAGHRQNGDLLGFKFGVWEGGHRVPMIVRWPGQVEAGSISNQLIGNVDMLATFAAVTGQTLDEVQQADSVNMLPAFVDEPEKQIRDHLVLAPHKGTHLSIRKGKWMFIPARGSGGFGGKKPGNHTFAGPAAASFVGSVNSDIENGKIKKDAPRAQLYNLEQDVNQTQNIYLEHPDVVKELTSLLASYQPKPGSGKGNGNTPAGKKRPRGNSKPAKKMPATPSTRSASFDFESGTLEPWKVIEGQFGHPIGSRDVFFRDLGEYNKQGKYYLTTLEGSPDAERGSDSQTGVIVSPHFIPQAGPMTFRVGGGNGQDTYVALCRADGTELQKARGVNNQEMQEVRWGLTPYAGKKLYLKIVDRATGGWGHITADDFQFDAEVLTVATKNSPGKVASRPGVGKSNRPPNFVIIFTDDQGYADVGCFGSPDIRTPRLDAMAAEGMKFTSFYAQPVCGPSRAALMTGCYPMRVAERGNTKQVHPILHSDEITIAEILQAKGYATACFGKWDLAKHSQEDFFIDLFPTRQGFDEFFGTPTSNDRIANLYRNEELIEPKTNMAMLTQRYTDEAIRFMKKNSEKPFFVYIPHSMPHTRLDASPQFKGQSPRGLYGDVIEEIDFNVGRVLDAVNKMGLAENTYVIFTSDNGPWLIKNKNHADGHLPGDHGGSAGPLRSGKVSTFEGGVRVPCIVWGPGRVPAGSTCKSIASTLDVLPTLAALASADVPSDRVIDGEDIRHLIHGKFDQAHVNKAFYYYLRVHLQAVRQGQWKLHLRRRKEPIGAAPFSRNTHIAVTDRIGFDAPFLVDLNNDIGETTNVAHEHPEVTERLLALAESMRVDLGDFDRVGRNMRFFDLDGDRPTKPPVPKRRKSAEKK